MAQVKEWYIEGQSRKKFEGDSHKVTQVVEDSFEGDSYKVTQVKEWYIER